MSLADGCEHSDLEFAPIAFPDRAFRRHQTIDNPARMLVHRVSEHVRIRIVVNSIHHIAKSRQTAHHVGESHTLLQTLLQSRYGLIPFRQVSCDATALLRLGSKVPRNALEVLSKSPVFVGLKFQSSLELFDLGNLLTK